MTRFLFLGLVLVLVGFVSGCSEDGAGPVGDQAVPEVVIYYPPDTAPLNWVVSDSIDVYVGARDLGAGGGAGSIAKVELLFSKPGQADRVTVGDARLYTGAVPDSVAEFISLPPGWSLYYRKWYTGPTPLPPIGTPINSNTTVQLFAQATDQAGNVGRTTGFIPIDVFNFGDDLRPPLPQFVVTPASGDVATIFEFDPSPTTDRLDPNTEISVRWDFDASTPEWDIDWDDGANASEVQQHQYENPGTYEIKIEAHNTYLAASIARPPDPTFLTVTPLGGRPRPPDPENYIEIPAGRYPIGKAAPDTFYVLDGVQYRLERSEMRGFTADVRARYRISRYEISNRVYLRYLNEAINRVDPAPPIRYANGIVHYNDRIPPQDTTWILFRLDRSKIFFSLDGDSLAIIPGFENHPVTGVSWYGASQFSIYYGMRLPTEAEWEIAARGTDGLLDYPFVGGVDLPAAQGRFRVNYKDARRTGDPFVNSTTPVGFFNGQVYDGFQTIDTPSAWGIYDLAGNVREWVYDWFGPYPTEEGQTRLNPNGPGIGDFRVARGGSANSSRAECRSTVRRAYDPAECYESIGFRSAFNPID